MIYIVRSITVLLVSTAAIAAASVSAQEQPEPAAEERPDAETTVVSGQRVFRSGALDESTIVKIEDWRGAPTMMLFWDINCAPCLVEMRSLGSLSERMPGWRIKTISLSERRLSVAKLRQLGVNEGQHFAAINAARLLTRLGNAEGAMPY